MKFLIDRTSDYEGVPCTEAIKENNNNSLLKYSIEINTLEELIDFSNKYGQLIISTYENINYIEIYDDHREC